MSIATRKCTDAGIVDVAEHVCAYWPRFVSHLSPSLFLMAKIKVIKDENRDDVFCQCPTALETWTNKFGRHTNQQSVSHVCHPHLISLLSIGVSPKRPISLCASM